MVACSEDYGDHGCVSIAVLSHKSETQILAIYFLLCSDLETMVSGFQTNSGFKPVSNCGFISWLVLTIVSECSYNRKGGAKTQEKGCLQVQSSHFDLVLCVNVTIL